MKHHLSFSILTTSILLSLFYFVGTASAATGPILQVETNGIKLSVPYCGNCIDFGSVQIGESKIITFTITNIGDGNLSLNSPTELTAGDTDQFEIVSQPAKTILAAGETTNFQIAFKPTNNGSKTVGVSIENNYKILYFNITGRGGSSCKTSGDSMNATVHSTEAGGKWNNPDTWMERRTPGADDIAQINGPIDTLNFDSYSVGGLEVSNCGILSDNGLFITVNGDVINNGTITTSYMNVSGNITNNGTWANVYELKLIGSAPRSIGGLNPIKSKTIRVTENDITILNSPVIGGLFLSQKKITLTPGQSITFLGDVQMYNTITGADKIILKGNSQRILGYKITFEANEVRFENNGELKISDSTFINGDLFVGTGSNVTGSNYRLNINGNVNNKGSINIGCLVVSGKTVNNGTLIEQCSKTTSSPTNPITTVAPPTGSPTTSSTLIITVFTDTTTHWAKDYIIALYEKGIVKGRTATTFEPDATINRAELIKMTTLAMGLTVPSSITTTSFADVSTTSWFAPYVETAFKKGIIEGTMVNGKRYFRPNDAVVRAEALKMLLYGAGHNAFDKPLASALFTDVSVNDWFSGLVAYAKANNIVSGYSDGSFKPAQQVTRAEASKMLFELFFESV
jgi:hypothetical protein